MGKCSCGPEFLTQEVVGGVTQTSCMECGIIHLQDILSFRPTFNIKDQGQSNPETHFLDCQSLPNHFKNEKLKRSTSSTTFANRVSLDSLDRLSHSLKLSKEVTQDARLMAEKVLKSYHYKKSHWQRKKIMSGICVYLTMVKESLAVVITDVCRLIDCSRSDFASEYFKFLSIFQDWHPKEVKVFEGMVPLVLRSMRLKDSTEETKVSQTTVRVMEVIDSVFGIMTGKSPIFVMIASSFLAWKSLDVKRSKLRFCTFSEITNFRFGDIISVKNIKDKKLVNQTVNKRVREIEGHLITLGRKLPCLKHITLNKKNITCFLKEVLENVSYLSLVTKEDIQKKRESEVTMKEAEALKARYEPDIDGDQDIDDEEIDSYIRGEDEVAVLRDAFHEDIEELDQEDLEEPGFENILNGRPGII